MIPFKLFFFVYLKYFITRFFIIILCYFADKIVKTFDISHSIVFDTLSIICITYCYKLIVNRILFGKYKRILVKINGNNNISWKFYCCLLVIPIGILELYSAINEKFNIIPIWISFIIFVIIDYLHGKVLANKKSNSIFWKFAFCLLIILQ